MDKIRKAKLKPKKSTLTKLRTQLVNNKTLVTAAGVNNIIRVGKFITELNNRIKFIDILIKTVSKPTKPKRVPVTKKTVGVRRTPVTKTGTKQVVSTKKTTITKPKVTQVGKAVSKPKKPLLPKKPKKPVKPKKLRGLGFKLPKLKKGSLRTYVVIVKVKNKLKQFKAKLFRDQAIDRGRRAITVDFPLSRSFSIRIVGQKKGKDTGAGSLRGLRKRKGKNPLVQDFVQVNPLETKLERKALLKAKKRK